MRIASLFLLVVAASTHQLGPFGNVIASADVGNPVAFCRSAFGGRDFSVTVTMRRQKGAWRIAGLSYSLTYGRDPIDSDLAPLGSLETLETLEFWGNASMESRARFSVRAVRDLVRLRLRRLLLRQTPTDECMRAVCTLAELEDLDLFQCGLHVEMGDGGLANLRDLCKLRRLDLAGAGLTDKSLGFIAPLQTLEELDLSGNFKLTDGGLTQLSGLRNLSSLRLESLGAPGLPALESMPRLESLSADNFIASPGNSGLSVLRNLKQVSIAHIAGDAMAVVRLPETVRSLKLGGTPGKLDLGSCKKIDKVQLHAGGGRLNWAKVPELKWVLRCPSLRELTLDDAADADVSAVAALTSLRVLTITGACGGEALSDKGMRALAGLRQLECLTFRYSALADAGRPILPTLTGLRRLDLTMDPCLTVAALEGIWLLKELRSLKLDLSGEPLEDSADRVLANIKSLSKLEELSLEGRLTDVGLRNLMSLRSLRRLDLGSSDGHTDAGLKLLMDAMPNLEELTFKIEAKPRH